MSTLSVRVATSNPGEVHVRVWTYRWPGPELDWKGIVTSGNPIDQNWVDLEPGYYAITISWTEGFHNIASDHGRNRIIYNGNDLYYQVTAFARASDPVIGVFSVKI